MTARRLASALAPIFATFFGVALFSACSSDQAPSPNFNSVGGSGAQTTGGTTSMTSAGTTSIAGTTGSVAGSTSTGGGGGSGVAGSTGASGSTGIAGGTGAAGSSGHYDTPRGPSAACGMAPPAGDGSDKFVEHDIDVTGVDPAFIAANPPDSPAPWTWTHRNYFLRLPANYDPTKAYPISMAGGGCGSGDGKSGNGGGLTALAKGETQAIQIGLSYVWKGGACFADDYTNTPDPAYFDAVLKDVEAHFCVDRGNVFVDGYSSGAWEAYMLGCARAGAVRAIGTAAGGLRITRPPCTNVPIAAMMLNGLQDTENPIGPLATPKNDSYGSAPARDDILKRNNCTGSDNVPWDPDYPGCVKYTGCPPEFPVVWCAYDDGHGTGNPTGATHSYSGEGFWKFWSALPPVP